MNGLVGYGSSSEDEEEVPRVTRDAPQKLKSGHDVVVGNGSEVSSGHEVVRHGDKVETTKEVGSSNSNASKNAEDERSGPKKKKSNKKRKKKGKKSMNLPLLEEPVDVDNSEEEDEDEDVGKKNALKAGSIWDEEDLPVGNDWQDTVGPSLPVSSSSMLKESSEDEGEPEQSFVSSSYVQEEASTMTGGEMDRHIAKMLKEGKNISALGGRFVEMDGSKIRQKAKERQEARRAEMEMESARSTKISGSVEFSQAQGGVGLLKRKGQLTSLAYDAQEREADLQKQWSHNKKAKAATKGRYGW